MDKTNYFTVEVYGAQARACAQYLGRGSRVVVEAELDWREWADQQGAKREAVTFRARQVLFEGSRPRRQPPTAATATERRGARGGGASRPRAGGRRRAGGEGVGQRRRSPLLSGEDDGRPGRTTLLAWPYPGR